MVHTRIGRAVLTVVAVVLIGAVAAVVFTMRGDDAAPSDTADTAAVVRDSSHRLNDPANASVTVVEFLDFECEGCRAAYPVVEELRTAYGDRVEFVVRYFPLAGHVNGERAARAVEAAARQGRLEAMYRTMYETQHEWGEKSAPADDVFRGFAGDLGLNMAAFDAAYADPATRERVLLDKRDGQALGVKGTPTFFVNGAEVTLRNRDDLRVAIDAALQKATLTE